MLPMYHDKVCSDESAALIEEHLNACPHCSRILSALRSEIETPEKNLDEIKPLRKIQESYKKMKTHWLIAIIAVLLLIPVGFLVGFERGEQYERPVKFTQEEAIACANEFMTCLVEGNYSKAFTYWDLAGEKKDLMSGDLFTEADLVTFDEDGLEKFCQGGEKLESMGGFESFELVAISDPSYANIYGTESYIISYTVLFGGKSETFGVSISEYGISSLSSGNGLIRHPLSHLTLWIQWVIDDYQGRYYDFDLGKWVDIEKE